MALLFAACTATVNAQPHQGQQQRLSEVVVESTPLERTLLESAQPVTVLSGSDLDIRATSSLGETLAGEPGVAASSFGAGASRPVIRGLSGDRIRILENGVGSQDVSNTSPDHGVTIEPTLVEKIEIVRGPASLLYGTNAVGGIVNIFDNRIPEELPEGIVTGTAEVRGGLVDKERTGVASLTTPVGPIAFNVSGFLKRTDDYDIPGYARTGALRAESELEYDEPRRRVPFSATEGDSFSVGGSYIFDTGFFGVAVSEFNTNYGVPNGEEGISIDGIRRRLDLRGEIREVSDLIKKISTKVGVVDYEHTEFEIDEAGTKFTQDGLDARIELAHKTLASFDGVIGVQVQTSDFEAQGEEAFQPPTETATISGFIFEERPLSEDLIGQFGIRYDHNTIESRGFPGESAQDRSLSTLSQSLGAVWSMPRDYTLALSLAHTERAPTGQELYAAGPHVATAAYEIGDAELDRERSLGTDITLRKNSGSLRGSFGIFHNRFWNYINLAPDGSTEDDLPVYLFKGVDADFYGAESQISYYFIDAAGESLHVDLQPEYLYAEERETDSPLPRITPLRIKTGVTYYHQDFARARIEAQRVFAQERNAAFETESDGYTLVNAFISREIPCDDLKLEVYLRGTNLANEKARNHVSFIKDITPLPGASALAGLRVRF